MKKIQDEEFREYLEYKDFMGERPGESRKKTSRKLDLGELDQVRAAKGNKDFALFLKEMKAREEEE